jgi:hypothetical protein
VNGKLRRILVCLCLIGALMGWLSGYSYRKAINVGGSSGAGTNYQAKVVVQPGAGSDSPPTVYLNSHAAYFPNDLVFTSDDGETTLDHWFEYDCNNFWVKVPANLDSNQTIYLYYGSTSNLPNPIDAPLSGLWKRYGTTPVMTVGSAGAWDDLWVQFNSIVYDNGTYYAFYQGCKNDFLFRIGLATSSDGISWTKSGSNPVYTSQAAWDAAIMQPGTRMIKEDSTYYLYYWGNNIYNLSVDSGIGLATSTDLTTWTASGNNSILTGGGASAWDASVLAPTVIKFDSTYYLWYEGASGTFNRSRMGLASSASKDSGWTKYAGNPALNNAPDSWDSWWSELFVLVQVGNEWRAYYGGSNNGTPRCEVGLATYLKTGSGANTFLLFDDFPGFTLDAALWNNLGSFSQDHGRVNKYASNTNTVYLLKSQATYTGPLAVEGKCKVGSDWANEYSWLFALLFDSAWATTGYLGGHYKDASNDYTKVYKFGTGATSNGTNEAVAADTYYKYSLLVGSATQKLLVGGTQKGSISTSIQTNPTNVHAATARGPSSSAYTTYFEWVFVRKYIDTEPAISSFGSEEIPAAIFEYAGEVPLALGPEHVLAVAFSILGDVGPALSPESLYEAIVLHSWEYDGLLIATLLPESALAFSLDAAAAGLDLALAPEAGILIGFQPATELPLILTPEAGILIGFQPVTEIPLVLTPEAGIAAAFSPSGELSFRMIVSHNINNAWAPATEVSFSLLMWDPGLQEWVYVGEIPLGLMPEGLVAVRRAPPGELGFTLLPQGAFLKAAVPLFPGGLGGRLGPAGPGGRLGGGGFSGRLTDRSTGGGLSGTGYKGKLRKTGV